MFNSIVYAVVSFSFHQFVTHWLTEHNWLYAQCSMPWVARKNSETNTVKMNYLWSLNECRHHVIATAYKNFHRQQTLTNSNWLYATVIVKCVWCIKDAEVKTTSFVFCICLQPVTEQKKRRTSKFLLDKTFFPNETSRKPFSVLIFASIPTSIDHRIKLAYLR